MVATPAPLQPLILPLASSFLVLSLIKDPNTIFEEI